MRKLAFVLLLAACACAAVPEPVRAPAKTAVAPPGPDCRAPSASSGSAGTQPRLMLASAMWTPPPPVPPAPPQAAEFLRTHSATFRPTGDAAFDAYVARVLREGGSGWHPYLMRLFAGLGPNPAILAENEALKAPGSAANYVRRIVRPERIAAGRRLYSELKGRTLSAAHPNVPPEIVIALWGALSDYGARPPRFDMMDTYLNLGACGRGPEFTYFDIYHAAALILEGKVDRSRATAYGNGRIGQVQWLPDQYVNWGKDGDGDGRIDIWTSRADIFANLAPNDWEAGVPAIIEVERPNFDRSDPAQARMQRALESQSGLGLQYFRRPGGGAWPAEWLRAGGRFVAPFGDEGPFFVLTRNFTPLDYKNPFLPRYAPMDQEFGFGIAVSLLAEAIAGRPGPTRPIR